MCYIQCNKRAVTFRRLKIFDMLKRSYQKALFLFLCGKELQTNTYKLTLAKYQVIKPCKILQSF